MVNPPPYTEANAPQASQVSQVLYHNLPNQLTSGQTPQVLYSDQADQPTIIVINNDPGKKCPQCN